MCLELSSSSELSEKEMFKAFSLQVEKKLYSSTTVVGDYINTMKTTFNFGFDLYQAFTQHR